MPAGFFLPRDIQQPPTQRGKQAGCGSCGLYKGCASPKMVVAGEGRKSIFILGEAPREAEDARKDPFVGAPGKQLRAKLRVHGIDLERDCWWLNAINCRHPKEDHEPTEKELDACRPRVWRALEELKPKLVLLLGNSALRSFLSHRWNKDKLDGIARWRGWVIPDRAAKAWVAPIFDPSKIRQEDRLLCVEHWFDADLAQALAYLSRPFPFTDLFREEDLVRRVRDEDEVTRELTRLLRYCEAHPHTEVAVDIETTGLKPYRGGHQIVSCALAWGPDDCLSFFWPQGRHALARLHRLLAHPGIGKIAANLPFEDRWFMHFGFPVKNWTWDTLLASHVMDNRGGITGLKFQSYVQFGVLGYNDDADAWLKATEEEEAQHGTNGFNRILEFKRQDPDKLLLYNGMDALLEWRLASFQKGVIRGF